MHIKKFTQFILENEYYEDINEGDIVPGVTFNTGTQGTGKEKNVMYVHATPQETTISFNRGDGSRNLALHFPAKPQELTGKDKSVYTAYAYVNDTNTGTSTNNEKDDYYPSAITNMADFDKDKSSGPLLKASNSIDLLADFMSRSGIDNTRSAGSDLAKVIVNLQFNPKYNTQVTDSFKKFATKISGEITTKAFIYKLGAQFGRDKQDPGMQAFIEEFPISRGEFSPKKP